MAQIPTTLSFSDLALFEERYGQIDINQLLHELGFDISFALEHEECQHRNRRGEIVTGKLFMGIERSDKAWLDSGWASDEVKMAVRGDTSYNKEIASLSRRSVS